ncbi:leucyl-tRNA synthetase [Lasiodiplodia theobromae]|nr:leucyl-tRNA synthetase [Lasiodiplodia theobromae]
MLCTRVLNWLNQWACVHKYGLGSKLPWDPKSIVESLSDIYGYTISHYLHKDTFGQTPGLAGIGPDQMTDDVWDYVFTRRDLDLDMLQQCNIPEQVLASMRREVE